jgi:hypothetical protein
MERGLLAARKTFDSRGPEVGRVALAVVPVEQDPWIVCVKGS